MLNNIKNRKESGFTIIEVLIVLAIAGLILVVVFLAVPALNRTSHNQGYKTDASNILAAINEYSSNNGGTLPVDQPTTTTAFGNAKTNSIKNVNFVAAGTVTPITASATPGATAAAAAGSVSYNTAQFESGVVCQSQANATPTITGASQRSFALFYLIEGSGAPQIQCINS